ncbi:MAG: ATP-dependent 6-phosphofructokinase [Chitinivibrionia bacterium]|nr:ATP-dependent 6-phosphofructokinase [Chitinivibrionia bacterium]
MVHAYGNVCSEDFTVETLGERCIKSPLKLSTEYGDYIANFVEDNEIVVLNSHLDREEAKKFKPVFIEAAGPRKDIYFDSGKVKAAIVTCGGLCPGLNNVIRDITYALRVQYGVKNVVGIRNGYMGFAPESRLSVIDLTLDRVRDIHREGGTILGSARGYGNRPKDAVNCLEQLNANMLFVIGGDGTQKGALHIYEEAKSRGMKMAVVGIPKTIDNDLSFVRKSFGFETAVEKATEAVESATVEARGAVNGIGLVKLMGRESGFIAAHTAVAANNVDFVLVPEVPFDLEGENGFLESVRKKVLENGYSVVIVAEGAGQKLLTDFDEKYLQIDASGNKKLGDIGIFLRDRVIEHFGKKDMECNIKYIDPSYIIRSQPANANDSLYCSQLAANAVHAAMSGKTGILIGLVHNYYVHIPIKMAVSQRNVINPDGTTWRAVMESTGQPPLMK